MNATLQAGRSDAGDSLRVEMRFKNARLYDAISEASSALSEDTRVQAVQKAGPVQAFCKIYGLSKGQQRKIYGLLGLKLKPFIGKRAIRPLCQTLSDLLMIPLDELFPAELYDVSWTTTRLAFNIAPSMVPLHRLSNSMRQLQISAPQDDAYDRAEMRRKIGVAVDSLTPREQRVIRLRFGLDDGEERSLEQVGDVFAVSRERIRAIEAKALRKLRHPARCKKLVPYLDGHNVAAVFSQSDASQLPAGTPGSGKATPEDARRLRTAPPVVRRLVDNGSSGGRATGWGLTKAVSCVTADDLRLGRWCPEDVASDSRFSAAARVVRVTVPTGFSLPEEDPRVLVNVLIVDRG